MRHLAPLALASMFVCSPAAAQAPDPQIVAPIQKFMDSFNKGDAAGAAATHASTPDLFILDEVPRTRGLAQRRSTPGPRIWKATRRRTGSPIRA